MSERVWHEQDSITLDKLQQFLAAEPRRCIVLRSYDDGSISLTAYSHRATHALLSGTERADYSNPNCDVRDVLTRFTAVADVKGQLK